MDHPSRSTTHSASGSTPRRGAAAVSRDVLLRRLTALLRGVTFGGMAYLLGSCPLLFDSMPLGLALLCASSAHTWYILSGLILGALLRPVPLDPGIWITVYVLAVLLRLAILFFIDPPPLPGAPDDRTSGRELRYLALCWSSLRAMLSDVTGRGRSSPTDEGETPAPSSRSDGAPREVIPPAATRELPRPPHRRGLLFCENPFLRILTGSVCGFAAGLCGMVLGGFTFYDLFSSLFSILCVPCLTFLFMPCFREEGEALLFSPSPAHHGSDFTVGTDLSHRTPPVILVSVSLLLLAVTFSARGYLLPLGSPYVTIRLAPLLAILLTLSVTARLGLVPGLVVAILCGLGASPLLIPAFILCAVIYSVLHLLSYRAGVVGGGVAALAWCALIGDATVLVTHFLTLLLAIPLYFILDRLSRLLPAETAMEPPSVETADFSAAAVSEAVTEARRVRLRSLSDAFSSLSRLFYDMSDRLRRPRPTELKRACEEVYRAHCDNCERATTCWGNNGQHSMEALGRVGRMLYESGRVDKDSFPAVLKEQCPHTDGIISELNARCGELTEMRARSEKTEVFASDYEAMASLLNQALSEDIEGDGEAFACDREAADRIALELTNHGIDVRGVVVCGKRRRRITVRGTHFERAESHATAIRAALEDICNTRLSAPTFEIGDRYTVMRLASEPTLDVSYAGSTVPAGTGEDEILPPALTHETPEGAYLPAYTCGDHIALFKSEEAYFYALISDGMGSGEDASITSDICTLFLEKMLSAGNRAEISLRMLGSFIRQKNTGTGEECSATVDLMELDLMAGDALFVKNGAAPTYVVRGGTVYKLRSRTMPIGILRDSPPQLLRFRMHPGDVVVMVSDGVTHGNDECPWLIDMLSEPLPTSMDHLRLDILKHAVASGSPDDLSAIAVRVEDAREEPSHNTSATRDSAS